MQVCGYLIKHSGEVLCAAVVGSLLSSLADSGWCGKAVLLHLWRVVRQDIRCQSRAKLSIWTLSSGEGLMVREENFPVQCMC